MEGLAIFLVLVLVATPIVAILALSRVRQLASQLDSLRIPDLIARIYALETKIAALELPATGQKGEPVMGTSPAEAASPSTLTARPLPKPSSFPDASSPPPATQRDFTVASGSVAPALSLPSYRDSGREKGSSALDLESLIAGRWLNRVGILAVIVGVSFFLKYAFDNDWIGATGRVAIGILLGAAMLPWSQWLLGRGYSYFSEGIAALGQATLLLSIWAGCRYYTLFSTDVGFGAMIAVTAVMALVALGRNTERIALLSLLGGFLTPILLSTGKDEQVALFTYLLILGAGLLVISAKRNWRSLAPVSFLFTLVYYWGWYDTFYHPAKLERTLAFATLFFVLYGALPVLRAVRSSGVEALSLAILLLNSFAYFGALYVLLWPNYRWTLTILALALSAAHVGVARFAPTPKSGDSAITRQMLAGLALTFVTVAIPIRLDGKWITLALALEGAIVIWIGFSSQVSRMRLAGYGLLGVAAARALFLTLPAAQFFFNERFATYFAVVACMAVALYAARQHSEAVNQGETNVLAGLAVAINVFALIALSLEFWDHFGYHASLGIDSGLAQHLALSLLWTAYASVLILLGMKRASALLRWQALALFGLVVVKVFFYDSSYLQRFYRILSFLILGIVLLVISFLYQSKVSKARAAS